MTESRESLVGRAIEAAARARYEQVNYGQVWSEITEGARETWRDFVRPFVEAGLRVVADHCTERAEHIRDTTSGNLSFASSGTLHAVAAELRETPE